MKFLIITYAPHIIEDNRYYAYAPYVREMNLWIKNTDEVIVVAPVWKIPKTVMQTSYVHENITFHPIAAFDVLNFKSAIKAIFQIPAIFFTICKTMRTADHIHLRSPGNIGLLGCFAQILFPGKKKTAKYAGNWDPKSVQPLTYRLEKYILSNTFITKKMQVLVYGHWENATKNIKPFFTASYAESEKTTVIKASIFEKINFVFAGSLVKGKDPMYAIQLVEKLYQKGRNVRLDLFGDGLLYKSIGIYIKEKELSDCIFLHGNQSKEILIKAYQQSHFVILPSVSEGWPKAVAEGMFWGAIPIATPVSCVPFMLDFGYRGILLEMNQQLDLQKIELIIENESQLMDKSRNCIEWSQKYTIERFDEAIQKLVFP
ncbi:MAG: glycosyltransferase [Flavobacterium sp.]|nr:glycosyltransferase [Flavobacterium sp.]